MQHVTVGEGKVEGLVFGTHDIPEIQLEVGVYQIAVVVEAHAQAQVVGHEPGDSGGNVPGVEFALTDIEDGQDGIAVSGVLSGYIEQTIGTADAYGPATFGQEGAALRIFRVIETAQSLVNRVVLG